MRTFDIGSADKAAATLKFIKAATLRSSTAEDGHKHKAWLIGEVVKGKGEARVE
jgi:hypothetical protein